MIRYLVGFMLLMLTACSPKKQVKIAHYAVHQLYLDTSKKEFGILVYYCYCLPVDSVGYFYYWATNNTPVNFSHVKWEYHKENLLEPHIWITTDTLGDIIIDEKYSGLTSSQCKLVLKNEQEVIYGPGKND